MNELKMSDVWNSLPQSFGSIESFTMNGQTFSGDYLGLIFTNAEPADATIKAINSYDKNQELIANMQDRIESQLALLEVSGKRIERLESENEKQAEQIEMLREALTEIAKLPEVRMEESQYLACRALEQTSKD